MDGFGAFSVFSAAPHFGVGFVWGYAGTGWVCFVTSTLSKGLRPLDSHKGLLAPLTPRQSSRALQPLLLTRASYLFGNETNREVVEDNFSEIGEADFPRVVASRAF